MTGRHQVKLTKSEIEAALMNVCNRVVCYGLNEDRYERFTYLAKRLLSIDEGKPEINPDADKSNPEQSENPAPATSWS